MITKVVFGIIAAISGIVVVGTLLFLSLGDLDPHVPGHFHVSGEVSAPGQFLIPGRSNIVEFEAAIELAGGYTARADQERIEVVRGQRRIPVNAMRMAMYDSEGFSLFPGDTIVVSGKGGVQVQ